MDAIPEDAGDGSMQCTNHPFKNNTPAGGICALCLQEKLGKLVSSSFPIAVFPSSSSSSPSFRSEIGANSTSTTNTTTVSSAAAPPPPLASNTQISPSNPNSNCHHHQYLLTQKKNKKKDLGVFKRSKSTAGQRQCMYADNDDGLTRSTHKRGFWSFMHLQKHSHSSSSSTLRGISSNSLCASARSREIIVVEENESPNCHATFDRKVSRSRSVGCGSRSFSGDFFERISTGFGDCALRRVESHREGKSKVSGGHDCIKERVRCGGLFSGFMITSSSSSSSSYLVPSNIKETSSGGNSTGRVTSSVAGTEHGQQHSRSRSWGWALASPMRAFSKPSSSKREASNKNPNPNLAAIPSLLSVRS